MKKAVLIILSMLVFIPKVMAQTLPNGMNYQAVARDLTGEVISNQLVSLRINLQGGEDQSIRYYTETHNPTTNQFGLFSIVIGEGEIEKGIFSEIPWSTEDIWIEIAISDNNNNEFKTISNSKLYAVPYAFHANTASQVAGAVGDERGQGEGNVWKLVGNTNTDPPTDKLGTADETDLNIVTNDMVRLNIQSDGKSRFNDQVRIVADLPKGEQQVYDDYPLQIEGGKQGIAIKLTESEPKPDANWVTFFNADGDALGSIEGNADVVTNAWAIVVAILAGEANVTLSNGEEYNIENDYEYLRTTYFQNKKAKELGQAFEDVLFNGHALVRKAALATLTVGAWADLDDIFILSYKFDKSIKKASRLFIQSNNAGVSFSSTGADYAEWLEKAFPDENISFGEIVGVKGGKISKSFNDANQFMAITSNPIIVGGMPEKGLEYKFDKVALMGQVPVLVYGPVNKGDYILPLGKGDGSGIAKNPQEMKANDFARIIGVAWSSSNKNNTFSYINTAVGFNTNQIGLLINNMQVVMNKMQDEIAKLNSDYKPDYFNANENKTSYNTESQIDYESVAECFLVADCSGFPDCIPWYIDCFINNASTFGIDDINNNYIINVLKDYFNENVANPVQMIVGILNTILDINSEVPFPVIPEISSIIDDIWANDGSFDFSNIDLLEITNSITAKIILIKNLYD